MNLNDLFENLRTENPCWKGYKPVGTKEKNGRTVPNCVPKESVAEVSDETLTSYLTKVHDDSLKHEKDPTKRSPEKRNKSVAGFSRAFNKLDARKGVAEAPESTPFGNVVDQRPTMPAVSQQDRESQDQQRERQARVSDFREKKQDLLQQFAQLGTLRTEMIYGLENNVFLTKEQLIDFFQQQIDDPGLTALEYAHDNGIETSGLIKHILRRATQLGISMLDVRKMFNQAKQKVSENSVNRKTDAKGLTQSEWMQRVKKRFPDAKIIQSKMIDGPAHALLSDGRKIVWNPVQDVEEGKLEGYDTGEDYRAKAQWLMHTYHLRPGEAIEIAYYDTDPETWQDSPWEDDYKQDVAEAGANFRAGNARRAAINAMTPEERRAYDEKRAEQQRKRDEARLEKDRQRNAAKKGVAEGSDERKQNALWAQITAHEKAAKKSKDLKQQHHLKMADQLRSQLKTSDNEQGVAEGLNEFAPAGSGGGNIPRGPKTPRRGPWDDNGEDPYQLRRYNRSVDFFDQFDSDGVDKQNFDKATGEYEGYYFDRDAASGITQIAYFKFDDPTKIGDNDPGVGWYYEPVDEGVAEGEPAKQERPEADYGDDYQAMVSRVKKLAGLGPLKTVWDPQKRVYKNVPVAQQPKK